MRRLCRQLGAVLTLLCLPFALFGLMALDDGGDGDGGDGDGDSGDGDGDDEKDLNDAGKRALDRERAARRDADRARKASDRKAKELEDRLAKLETDGKSESDKAIEQARKEAEAEARKDERTKADQRIIRAGVREVAANKLADPADALLYLDLEDFSVGDDGEVDRKAIGKALDDLLKLKPYLAVKGQKGTTPGADGGARGETGSGPEVSPGIGRLRHAYSTTSKKT
jgi:membrane protein involved in colicin uptake